MYAFKCHTGYQPNRFRQVGDAGMQNESFQLIHYTRDHRIEAVAY